MWKLRLPNALSTLLTVFLAVLLFNAMIFEAQATPVLDATFGTAGKVRIGAASGAEDTPYASALQRDGKLLVAGWTTGRQAHNFVLRLNANGALDSAFGNAGVALFDVPNDSWSTITQIEQRPDGSILLATQVYDGFLLTLLTPAGAVDTTFASNGFFFSATTAAYFVQQADRGILLVSDATQGSEFSLRLTQLTATGSPNSAFAPNGEKILNSLDGLPANFKLGWGNRVVADVNGGFTALASATFDGGTYLLLRVTAAGALDSHFGAGGLVSGFDLGRPFDVPAQLVATSDGKFLLLGDKKNDSSGSFVGKVLLWRVTAVGALDPSFGVAGRVEFGDPSIPAYSSYFRLNALENGGLALLEYFGDYSSSTRVWRLDASGALDTGFGVAGNISLFPDGYIRFRGIGVLPGTTGGLLIPAMVSTGATCAFYCTPAGIDVAVARLDATGSLSTTYGRGDGFALWNNPEYSTDSLENILLEPSGKLMLTGFSNTRGTYDHLLTRLNANGALDASFGKNGRTAPQQSTHCAGVQRAIEQPSGAVVIATGTAAGSFCTVGTVTAFRVDTSGVVDTGFQPSFTGAPMANAAVALGVRPDGRLLYGTTGYGTSGSALLQQTLPDGAPDLTFGTGGTVTFPLLDEGSRQADLAVLDDGSVIFAVLTTRNLRLYKVDAHGVPVASFGENGQFAYAAAFDNATSIGIPFSWLALSDGSLFAGIRSYAPAGSTTESLLAIRVSANGALMSASHLLAGVGNLSWRFAALPDASVLIARNEWSTRTSSLYRLFSDNTVDPNFGINGAFLLPGVVSVSALAVDANQRLLVAGQDATSAVLMRYELGAPSASAPAVEYYNTGLQHYFVTAGPGEMATIDAGGAGPGWQRTSYGFRAYLPETGIPIGALPVCRFYGTPGRGPNSHFYTVSATECASVKQDLGWTYEGIAFYLFAPHNGQCATGQQAVYRVYNNRYAQNDSNHRYTPDLSVYAQMQAQGWLPEGVVFCAPAQ